MEKVLHKELMEFTYESKEDRDNHVEEMISKGWSCSGRGRRIKLYVLWESSDKNNYEWFTEFSRNL